MLLACAHNIELVKQQLWKGGGGSEAKFLTSFLIFWAILKGKAFFKESLNHFESGCRWKPFSYYWIVIGILTTLFKV